MWSYVSFIGTACLACSAFYWTGLATFLLPFLLTPWHWLSTDCMSTKFHFHFLGCVNDHLSRFATSNYQSLNASKHRPHQIWHLQLPHDPKITSLWCLRPWLHTTICSVKWAFRLTLLPSLLLRLHVGFTLDLDSALVLSGLDFASAPHCSCLHSKIGMFLPSTTETSSYAHFIGTACLACSSFYWTGLATFFHFLSWWLLDIDSQQTVRWPNFISFFWAMFKIVYLDLPPCDSHFCRPPSSFCPTVPASPCRFSNLWMGDA